MYGENIYIDIYKFIRFIFNFDSKYLVSKDQRIRDRTAHVEIVLWKIDQSFKYVRHVSLVFSTSHQ